MNRIRHGVAITIVFIIVYIFSAWFTSFKTLSSGDWPYLFKETIQSFSFSPNPDFLWLAVYYQWTSKFFVGNLNFSWELYERVFWFWMFLVISFFSSWYFSKVIFGKSKFNFLSVLIFMTNTYILMVVGGGQMGVALAYSLAPCVLGSFIQLFRPSPLEKNSKVFWFSVLLSLQLMFDPRIFYVTNIAILLYVPFFSTKKRLKSIFFPVFISYALAVIVNLFWIIPLVLQKTIPFGSSKYFDSSKLQYLSFAHFEDAFALLHPNWPENLFGKAYFLRPEFLILPLFAFSSLLFARTKTILKKEIIFFGLLGLVGVFLAKGTQEPYGEVYSFLFDTIPGFFLFRDPTKSYVLIVLSYSILIPFALEQFSKKLSSASDRLLPITPILFIVFWAFLIRQSLLGQLSGTFKPHKIPQSYVSLKNFLVEDKDFSKTLWIPSRHVFTFYSNTHPFMEGSQVFGTLNDQTISAIFNNKKNKEFLKKQGIGYLILAEDTEGKLFTVDRKYSEKEYQKILRSLNSVENLKQTASFGKIVVFKVQ